MPAASGRSRRMRRRRPRCWHLRDRQRRPRRHKGATGSLKLSLQGDAEIQTDEPMFRIGRGEAGRRHIVRMGDDVAVYELVPAFDERLPGEELAQQTP